jgi:hypothetical protein
MELLRVILSSSVDKSPLRSYFHFPIYLKKIKGQYSNEKEGNRKEIILQIGMRSDCDI